jgi:hypothetical protein
LSQVQGNGSTAEASAIGNGNEGFQLTQFHSD